MGSQKEIPLSEVVEDIDKSFSINIISLEDTHEFIRYFVASAIALAVDFSALWILTSVFLVPYLVSGSLAFTLGLVVIYILSTQWVFTRRSMQNKKLEFLLFASIGIVGLTANHFILWFFTEVVDLFYIVSKVVSVGVVFLWNFSARKLFLFSV